MKLGLPSKCVNFFDLMPCQNICVCFKRVFKNDNRIGMCMLGNNNIFSKKHICKDCAYAHLPVDGFEQPNPVH